MLTSPERASGGTTPSQHAALNARSLVFLLAISLTLGWFAACGSGGPTTSPPPPPPPPPDRATFSGTVRSGGVGLASVQVVLSGDASANALTNSQGAFSFAEVSGTRFVVTPSLQGYLFTPPNYQVGAASRADLDFAAAKSHVDVGDTAPDFTAVDQNGQTVPLSSYRGKVILLDFSADW